MAYLWPLILIVVSNSIYHICAKSLPAKADPFAALTVTYLIGAVFSAALYFLLNRGSADLAQEWRSLNWTPYVLGFIVVAMEAGNVYAYRAGWSVNTLPVVQAACVAVLLLALGFLLRLRRTGWLEEQPGSYESEPTLAFVPEVAPLLDALEEILNPRVVTYTGKLYKAWQLLQGVGEEKNPYENVLREVASDLEALNKSLRALNASIGHYIDRLTRNRTPQEVLELFDQYEEKVVAAAYHRFKTSDNLFNYRAYLEEGLDACEETYLPQLALDYARVERCAPGEAAPRVRALIQQQRDALEEMSTLIREIDASHIRYRKRAVQRAQFLLLSDRSSQGSVTALLRRYAEDIRTPEQLFEPDDGPVAKRLHLYPAAVFGEKFLYPPAAQRTAEPLAPVHTEAFDPEQLRREQQLLLDYARLAVTEENVALLARQALAARPQVNASALAEEYPGDFARIIGLHTYSQSPHRDYDIQLTGNWVERGGFRFQDFVLTRRKEENDGND